MNKKNAFLILLFVLLGSALNAQMRFNSDKEMHRQEQDQKRFSFGYYLGVNLLSFAVVPNEEQGGTTSHGRVYLRQDGKLGFSVGLMGRLRVHDNIDLKIEPGVHFAERNLYFGNIEGAADSTRVVKSTYIDIPLIVKIHGDRWVNTRPYIQGGLGYAMNLQSNEDKDEDNANNVFRMKTNNFNWQAEVGVEIYFKKFKLTPSVKGIFFFNNEISHDEPDTDPQWTGSIRSISTRGLFFSIKFE